MKATKTSLQKVPVYEVRLVQSRRPLRLAETSLSDPRTSARALHSLIAAVLAAVGMRRNGGR